MNLIRKRVSQPIAGRRIARKYGQFRLKDHAGRRSIPPKWWTKWWARSRPATAPGEKSEWCFSIDCAFLQVAMSMVMRLQDPGAGARRTASARFRARTKDFTGGRIAGAIPPPGAPIHAHRKTQAAMMSHTIHFDGSTYVRTTGGAINFQELHAGKATGSLAA